MQGLMVPVLEIRLCITIPQFTAMNQTFQHLLVPIRMDSTRNHLMTAKGETRGINIIARKLGKLPTHYTPSVKKLTGAKMKTMRYSFLEV